jgi:hypothetical protein
MNTITTNSWNAHNGPEIAELIDRASAEMPDVIDGIMADTWDGYDPWGSNIAAWFALEEACLVTGLPNHPEYHNPTGSVDEDDWQVSEFVAAIEQGRITEADITTARDVMARFDHACRLAGLDY